MDRKKQPLIEFILIGLILRVSERYISWWIPCQAGQKRPTVKIKQCIFSKFGIPKRVVTDNAKEFVSDDVIRWLNNMGAVKIQTLEYNLSSNGAVERMVQTVKWAMSIWKPSSALTFFLIICRKFF